MEFQDLLRTLCFVGSRTFLLQVEQELKNLIQVQQSETKSDTWHRIRFPSMTSNHRWMIHVTAARFRLDSTSVGWGYDRTTTVTCNKHSRVPILSYSDFIPSCNSDAPLSFNQLTDLPRPVAHPTPSTQNNDNTLQSDTLDSKQTEKKRRRPNFSQPYSVARRMQSSTNQTENDNASPEKSTLEAKVVNVPVIQPAKISDQQQDKTTAENSEPKKVRGRGAVGRMRSTEPLDDIDEETGASSLKGAQPTSPIKKEAEQTEEDMQPEPTVALTKDYSKYTAETIRSQEERHNKSYADLSPNCKTQSKPSKWKEERVQISWSDAWQLRKQGKGVIEFGCNKLDASQKGSLCVYLSPNSRSTPKNSTLYITLYSKQPEGSSESAIIQKVFVEIGTGIPGESNVLHTGTCPIIHENQMISFWVALTGETLMIGAGLFPQNRFISLSCGIIPGLLYFGFAAWNHAIRLKNITIKGPPCDVLATRSHLLVMTVNSSSMEDIPSLLLKLCYTLLQDNSQIKCYPIRNCTFFVVCANAAQADSLFQAFKTLDQDKEPSFTIVDASFATACTCKDEEVRSLVTQEIEFETISRPNSDATVANRMITRFVSQ